MNRKKWICHNFSGWVKEEKILEFSARKQVIWLWLPEFDRHFDRFSNFSLESREKTREISEKIFQGGTIANWIFPKMDTRKIAPWVIRPRNDSTALRNGYINIPTNYSAFSLLKSAKQQQKKCKIPSRKCQVFLARSFFPHPKYWFFALFFFLPFFPPPLATPQEIK